MGAAQTTVLGLVALWGMFVQEANRPGRVAGVVVANETKSVIVNADSATEAKFKAEADNPGWRSQFAKKVGKNLWSVLMAKNSSL